MEGQLHAHNGTKAQWASLHFRKRTKAWRHSFHVHKQLALAVVINYKPFLMFRSHVNSWVTIKKTNTFNLEKWSLHPKSLEGKFYQIEECESKAWFKETTWISAQKNDESFLPWSGRKIRTKIDSLHFLEGKSETEGTRDLILRHMDSDFLIFSIYWIWIEKNISFVQWLVFVVLSG